MKLDFHGYRINEVWERTTVELRREVSDFWIREGALTDAEQARERSWQLAAIVRGQGREVIGVSTVYRDVLGRDAVPHYFYRMFIAAPHRRPILMVRVLDFTRDALKKAAPIDPAYPAGMVFVTENRKIMRPGARRMLQRHGYIFLGQTGEGLDVWRAGFHDNLPGRHSACATGTR